MLTNEARPADISMSIGQLVGASILERLAARNDLSDATRIHLNRELRARLAESGRFKVVDIAPVIKESHASNLQACGGCDVTFADRIGAELSVTGTVYKVSNLILNMMIFVRDAKTGDNVVVMQAEMRGDTEPRQHLVDVVDRAVGQDQLATGQFGDRGAHRRIRL